MCPLDYLSVDTIRRRLTRTASWASLCRATQWIWEQMERYDAMLMTCITKPRDDALSNRVLDEYHPGQPHLVDFSLSCVDKTTPDKEIANAAAPACRRL